MAWLRRLDFLSRCFSHGLATGDHHLRLVLQRRLTFWQMVHASNLQSYATRISKANKEVLMECSPLDFLSEDGKLSSPMFHLGGVISRETQSCIEADSSLIDAVCDLALVCPHIFKAGPEVMELAGTFRSGQLSYVHANAPWFPAERVPSREVASSPASFGQQQQLRALHVFMVQESRASMGPCTHNKADLCRGPWERIVESLPIYKVLR